MGLIPNFALKRPGPGPNHPILDPIHRKSNSIPKSKTSNASYFQGYFLSVFLNSFVDFSRASIAMRKPALSCAHVTFKILLLHHHAGALSSSWVLHSGVAPWKTFTLNLFFFGVLSSFLRQNADRKWMVHPRKPHSLPFFRARLQRTLSRAVIKDGSIWGWDLQAFQAFRRWCHEDRRCERQKISSTEAVRSI